VPRYRPDIRGKVADTIRRLPPSLKRTVRAAIRALAADPAIGEPLHGELEGRFKYRVRRYRIVYRVDHGARVLHIIAVGHRRSIYEELASGDPTVE
jgi:mRNA interferase RelE/StbE